jgi:alcohol dehydrogenase YqhD (iron-dependent ADH family)
LWTARNVFDVHEKDDGKAASEGVELYIQWLKRMCAPDTFVQLAGKKIPSEKLREIARRILKENQEVGRLVKLREDDIVSIFEASCVSLS